MDGRLTGASAHPARRSEHAPRALVVGLEATPGKLCSVVVDANQGKTVISEFVGTTKLVWDASVPVAAAVLELLTAAQGALDAAGATWNRVLIVAVCTTAVDVGEQPREELRRQLEEVLPQGEVVVQSTTSTALASGTGGALLGCVLVAGVDSSRALGVLEDRRSTTTAGWGPTFGDGGSAFALGSQALAAVSRAHDGRGTDTALTAAVLQHLRVASADQLPRWAEQHASLPERLAQVAGLAPCVLGCAAAGDAVSAALVHQAVGELVRSLRVVAVRLGLDKSKKPFNVVLAGCMLQRGTFYTQRLLDGIKDALPTANVVYPKCEPAEAVALLACWLLQQLVQRGPAGA